LHETFGIVDEIGKTREYYEKLAENLAKDVSEQGS